MRQSNSLISRPVAVCELAGTRLLSREQYIAFFIGAAKVLEYFHDHDVPPLGREDSVIALATLRVELGQAWQADTQFQGDITGGMTFVQFYNAVFELLDNWTTTTSVLEYNTLAFRLLDDVAR